MVPRFDSGPFDLLCSIDRFSRLCRVRLYAVGGMVRDIFLLRSNPRPDFDFAIARGSFSFGRKLAKHLKGAFVPLDRQHGSCRIVARAGRVPCTVDLTDFRGASLELDLRARDYTVNALAVDLRDLLTARDLRSVVIDPLEGYEDIRAGRIRLTREQALIDDPLRILRAFSCAAQLGFRIQPSTRRLLGKHRHALKGVSPERIRDELFKVLESPDAASFVEALDELKILDILFPEIRAMRRCAGGPYHHLDVWKHSVEALRRLEQALTGFRKNERMRAYLDACLCAGRTRSALLKIGALFHDVAKPAALRRQGRKLIFHGHDLMGARMVAEIARRLKLSNAETEALRIMVKAHLRPGYLSDFARPTPRSLYRFFRDTAEEALSVLLLSLGDQRATRGPLTTPSSHLAHERLARRLIKEYFRRKDQVTVPRILSGHDIMTQFKLAPSPLVGSVLAELDELQATGRIHNRAGALKAARAIVSRQKK